MRHATWSRRAVVLVAAVATLGLVPAAPGAAATGFTVVPTPNPGTASTVGGVAVLPSGVWAVGQASSPSYSGCHGRTLALRSGGAAFTEVQSVPAPMCASVDGVAGTSDNDIWAVGSTNNGRDTHIRHWDGTTWSAVPGAAITVPPSGGRQQRTTGLNAISARTAGDVWAVGRAQYSDFSRRALIEHWTGNGWSLVTAPGGAGSVLDGVTTLPSGDAWAVGHGAGITGGVTLVERWNGSSWSVVPSPNANVQNALHGVAAVSAADAWAVGESTRSFTDGVSTTRTLIERWNGSTWTAVPSPNVGTGNNTLAAAVARSASDVWAVGYYDDVTGVIPVRRTLAMHWDGRTWAVVASQNAGTGDNWLTEVTAAPGAVWASGVSAAGTLVERFPG